MSLLAQSLSENRRTLSLASPIIAGYVGQMLMGWADTIMVGQVGVIPLAACAFANNLLAVPLVFGFAVLSSVSVRASHAFGGGGARMAGEALRAGLVVAGVLGGGRDPRGAPPLALAGPGSRDQCRQQELSHSLRVVRRAGVLYDCREELLRGTVASLGSFLDHDRRCIAQRGP